MCARILTGVGRLWGKDPAGVAEMLLCHINKLKKKVKIWKILEMRVAERMTEFCDLKRQN